MPRTYAVTKVIDQQETKTKSVFERKVILFEHCCELYHRLTTKIVYN